MEKFFSEKISPLIHATSKNSLVPVLDSVIKLSLEQGIAAFLQSISADNMEEKLDKKLAFFEETKQMPIVISSDEPNEERAIPPAEFYKLFLGPQLKFTAGLWPHDSPGNLETSEEAMLRAYCERAEIQDGMKVLDLWATFGAVSIYVAKHYPRCSVIAVTANREQTKYIQSECEKLNLSNLRVVQSSLDHFNLHIGAFRDSLQDRILITSVSHIKNVQLLMERVSQWLAPDGIFFVHALTHAEYCSHFDQNLEQHLFPNGTIFSQDAFIYFQNDLLLLKQWALNGVHGSRSAQSWLSKLDENQDAAIEVLKKVYAEDQAIAVFAKWRKTLLAIEVLLNFSSHDFFISQYIFAKRCP